MPAHSVDTGGACAIDVEESPGPFARQDAVGDGSPRSITPVYLPPVSTHVELAVDILDRGNVAIGLGATQSRARDLLTAGHATFDLDSLAVLAKQPPGLVTSLFINQIGERTAIERK